MATKRTGLGRGIGALIPGGDDNSRPTRPVDVFFPDSDAMPATAMAAVEQAAAGEGLITVPGAHLARLDPDDIVPNAQQPRSTFDPDDLAELVHSVREFGVLQPIVVRPHPDLIGKYELVMGERRLRATKLAGLDSIPAVVKETANEDMLRDALLENLHRSQLNPLEEASAYQQLLADFGITQEELASRIGRSRPQISNTLRLLKLPEPVQLRVASGVLSAGHARAILSLGEADEMQRFADKIVNEELSVRAAEAIATKEPKPSRVKPAAGKRQDFLDDLATRLGDRLNTRVKIALGSRKGQISIDFATVQDLRRILTDLGEELEGV
jgi:ParB family transcriptional regulator, chromosome partitioning protein